MAAPALKKSARREFAGAKVQIIYENYVLKEEKFITKELFERNELEASESVASTDGRALILLHSFWFAAKQVHDKSWEMPCKRF